MPIDDNNGQRPSISRKKQTPQQAEHKVYTITDNSDESEFDTNFASDAELVAKLNQASSVRNAHGPGFNKAFPRKDSAEDERAKHLQYIKLIEEQKQQEEEERIHFDPRMSYEEQKIAYERQQVENKVRAISVKLSRLLESTTIVKDVQVTPSLTFRIKNLTTEEYNSALLKSLDTQFILEQNMIVKNHLIAQAIHSISGFSIKAIFDEDTLENRLKLVKQLDFGLSVRLHKEVLALQKECEDRFTIKTEDEAKEIIEEIKKA